MTNDFKRADKYVTFIPTNEEFDLLGTVKGYTLCANNKDYLNYGFEKTKNYSGQEYYQFVINTPEKLKQLTNAYNLRYEAIYKGQKFTALIEPGNPVITLMANTENRPGLSGFENWSKGEWVKDVDISEVEIITIKEPIDLNSLLRK